MDKKLRIVCAVSNDLNYDQRMQRICTSLHNAGYEVTLIGRQYKDTSPIVSQVFKQKRMSLLNKNGFLFYAEYNIRLFFHLLFCRADAIVAIDLDTICAVWLAAILKRKRYVYDAHEYFPEQKNIIERPKVYKFWKGIERRLVPRYKHGYTVCKSIADIFEQQYGVHYSVVMNAPPLSEHAATFIEARNIIYQGAINKGRGLKELIYAMKQIDSNLLIYGDGPYLQEAKQLCITAQTEHKVKWMGKFIPEELKDITRKGFIGINLVEPEGQNEYFSLANKFFDYMHNNVPQVTMNFPEYAAINKEYEVAVLVDELSVNNVTKAINELLHNEQLYNKLKENCKAAAEKYNWENEEKKLIEFYKKLF